MRLVTSIILTVLVTLAHGYGYGGYGYGYGYGPGYGSYKHYGGYHHYGKIDYKKDGYGGYGGYATHQHYILVVNCHTTMKEGSLSKGCEEKGRSPMSSRTMIMDKKQMATLVPNYYLDGWKTVFVRSLSIGQTGRRESVDAAETFSSTTQWFTQVSKPFHHDTIQSVRRDALMNVLYNRFRDSKTEYCHLVRIYLRIVLWLKHDERTLNPSQGQEKRSLTVRPGLILYLDDPLQGAEFAVLQAAEKPQSYFTFGLA
ncbi:hypothetical protein CLF_103612 [Clonorchis sinensis]|uniref:Uncharacterized protein n=1 Tax=Clonorchis sinensis TaxID=79923 RepID=G7YA14_CLOSI|nr:hypothetical protein CLF_103612 [Clonorchis sinensis]